MRARTMRFVVLALFMYLPALRAPAQGGPDPCVTPLSPGVIDTDEAFYTMSFDATFPQTVVDTMFVALDHAVDTWNECMGYGANGPLLTIGSGGLEVHIVNYLSPVDPYRCGLFQGTRASRARLRSTNLTRDATGVHTSPTSLAISSG